MMRETGTDGQEGRRGPNGLTPEDEVERKQQEAFLAWARANFGATQRARVFHQALQAAEKIDSDARVMAWVVTQRSLHDRNSE